MKLIDAYRFADNMLANALTNKQRRKAEMVQRAVMSEPEVDAIPASWIRKQIQLPENAGYYSVSLSKMLRRWEEEK